MEPAQSPTLLKIIRDGADRTASEYLKEPLFRHEQRR